MRLKKILIFTMLIAIPLYSQDWAVLQNTLIKFYRYQRSGLKPTADNSTGNPYNPFYTTTGSGADAGKYPHWTDAADGGWYDAGDFMKFGLPLGFSVYCLLKGYDVFGSNYDDINSWSLLGTKDNIPDVLNEAKVATDYLIKAVVSSSQVIQTIGNGASDHGAMSESGYGNSTRTANRPVSYCSGADVPGFYAAALALMSIVYRPFSATYADSCLAKAKLAYTFGAGKSTCCTEQTDGATGKPYYSSATYKDKMACAAIELYRATKDATYLTAAKTYFAGCTQNYDVLGYAHAEDLAAFEMYRSGDSTSKNAALGLINSDNSTAMGRVVKAGTNFVGGATVNTTNWGVCRTVGNSAFSAALQYMLNGDATLKTYAISQIKWLAGISPNTRSWITQYGTNFPQNPHSRNDINLRSAARLTGGVVSGPTSDNCPGPDMSTCSWSFTDNNAQYKNTECALDYGCGAIGATAFIRWTQQTTDTVRLDAALIASPTRLDMTTGSETITATLGQSAPWTVILEGQTSKAVKTYTGTGTSILVSGWKGDADAGSPKFTVEKVLVRLDTAKMKIWDIQRKNAAAANFDIVNVPVTAFGTNDIEVDNFDDTSKTNTLGGKWFAFSDASDSVAGGISSKPAISQDSGRGQAKGGWYFILGRSAGATAACGPYAGLRTTLSAQNTAVSMGNADTIMFDIKPLASGDSIWVQIEQTDITDKAYFGAKLTFGSAGSWVRVYVPIATMTQPSWKTAVKTLNTKSVYGLRLISFGAGSSRFLIDNLRVSNLTVTQSAVLKGKAVAAPHTGNVVDFYKISGASLSYGLFMKGAEGKTINAELFDCLGKKILSYTINNFKFGRTVSVKDCALRAGVYFLKHTATDTKKSAISSFMVNK